VAFSFSVPTAKPPTSSFSSGSVPAPFVFSFPATLPAAKELKAKKEAKEKAGAAASAAACAASLVAEWATAAKQAELHLTASLAAEENAKMEAKNKAGAAASAAACAASLVAEWATAAKQAELYLTATSALGAPSRVVITGLPLTNLAAVGVYERVQSLAHNCRPVFKLVAETAPADPSATSPAALPTAPAASTFGGFGAAAPAPAPFGFGAAAPAPPPNPFTTPTPTPASTIAASYLFSKCIIAPATASKPERGADLWCISPTLPMSTAPSNALRAHDFFVLDNATDPCFVNGAWRRVVSGVEAGAIEQLVGRQEEAKVAEKEEETCADFPKYAPTPEAGSGLQFVAITAMNSYSAVSCEELRAENCAKIGNRGAAASATVFGTHAAPIPAPPATIEMAEVVPSLTVHTIAADELPVGLQRLVRTYLCKVNNHRATLLMKRLVAEHDDGLLDGSQLESLRSRLFATPSARAIRALQAESTATVAAAAATMRQEEVTARVNAARQLSDRICVHPHTEELRIRLQWDAERPKAYAALLVQLSQTVGIVSVKNYVREQLADAMGRKMKSEPMRMRHLIIQGDFGTGKRTAAELVARLGKVLGAVSESCGTTRTFGESQVVHAHDRFSTHVHEVTSFEHLETQISPKSVYYMRVDRESKPCNLADTPVLEALDAAESMVSGLQM
jgi:hypothetical protein